MRSPIEEAARQNQLYVVYQPIVDFKTGRPFAYEALVRSKSQAFPDPPSILSAAIEAKAMGRVGRVIRELAAGNCPDAPLFLNIHPNEFDDSWLVRTDDPIFSHEHAIYLEITESVPLTHFKFCHGVLREVRGRGAKLAVDDLGAGYSNLKYIADLNPEVVKIDRDLVAGLRVSSRLYKLVAAIVRLCNDMGAAVVCEGIETYEEFVASRDAGAQYGQGYYFARPATPRPSYDWKALSNPPPPPRA
jgi:EAL domain-containing protein (putative c-di-GMP-specific phosphodiesterase class I)